jgi:alpha-1,2-mannosyltransferase
MLEILPPAAAVGKLSLAVALGSLSLATTAKLVKYGPTWKKSNVVAFIHPVAKDGGGGERVLWCAMRSIMKHKPEATIVLFTDLPPKPKCISSASISSISSTASEDEEDEEECSLSGDEEYWSQYMIDRALNKFGVELPSKVKVVEIKTTGLLDPSMYPRFTLLMQSLASIIPGVEALFKLTPQVYIDTCGVPFVLPFARLFGCHTACYVHYPVISTNMLERVKERKAMYNNRSTGVMQSRFKTAYYRLFALLYGCVGSFAQVCMTNSSWTRAHIQQIWWKFWWRRGAYGKPFRVSPPCNTEDLMEIPLKGAKRNTKQPVILSIGQFRPEKAHDLQLEAYALALKQAKSSSTSSRSSSSNLKGILCSKLVMVGGCRNEVDKQRVESLKQKAKEMEISNQVEFHVNVPYSQIKDLLSQALVGIHTMVDEHFGIGIVEYMAAGVVAVANNSGGPAADIIVPFRDEKTGNLQATGYLASTAEEYASALVNALCISDKEREKMCTIARSSIKRFSEQSFDKSFANTLDRILDTVHD